MLSFFKKSQRGIVPFFVCVSFTPYALSEDLNNSQQSNTTNANSLGEILVELNDQPTVTLGKYQSGTGVNKAFLQQFSNGNGDITSVLKAVSNVQFDSAAMSSTTPGEIDPANVSISGGLFYQNNFLLDGFNMNNDLDPNGGTTNSATQIRGGISQGLSVDTSLIESINVLDSNIKASYGGFTGGIIEAKTKRPDPNQWHGSLSFQLTKDSWTEYYIDESLYDNFLGSSSEYYQPRFTKYSVRANLSGYITEKFGITAAVSSTQSKIPLQGYSSTYQAAGEDTDVIKNQRRKIYNFYLKGYYHPTDNLDIEASVAYIPQHNTYYSATTKDSYYDMDSGGLQAGLKAILRTDLGVWNNQLSLSNLETSRHSDKSYLMTWRRSAEKNWAGTSSYLYEGGFGDIEQTQNSVNYKTDFTFLPYRTKYVTHTVNVGAELNYQSLRKARTTDYFTITSVTSDIQNTNGVSCGVDSFGLDTCSNVAPDAYPDWTGQYITKLRKWNQYDVKFNTTSYAAFLEDELEFDLKEKGVLTARVGLRLDGDNYLNKNTLAPRFSLNYAAPWQENKTNLVFGANRYYGRNLFTYRLYAETINRYTDYTRSSPDEAWAESSNTVSSSNRYELENLKVPYDDELMVGISQNVANLKFDLKYIHRNGKDEIMTVNRSDDDGDYYTWTNGGSSKRDIISLSVSNAQPINLFGVQNNFLFAFDYSDIWRSYNVLSTDDLYEEDVYIVYDGKVIKYKDRPTENYSRPYTLRLNTMHSFNYGKFKFSLNNFFRFRAPYEKMVRLLSTSSSYNADLEDIVGSNRQYAKYRFSSAFTWDLRLGFETQVYQQNTFFVNFDILNVLNKANMTTISSSSGSYSTSIPTTASAYPVYETGRQFWLEVGYKF